MIVFEDENFKSKMKFYSDENGDYFIEMAKIGEEAYFQMVQLDFEEVEILIKSLNNHLKQELKQD